MNPASGDERLPRTIAGLLGFAFQALAERAPLYVLLSLLVLATGAIAEWTLPGAVDATHGGQVKYFVTLFTSILGDALVIAAVALGVGTRAAGATASSRALAGGAVNRWLAVIGVSLMVQLTILATVQYSGFMQVSDAGTALLIAISAPVIWLLWGLVGLAGPIAALSTERTARATLTSFATALSIGLRGGNIARLGVLAAATILPAVLAAIAQRTLFAHHVDRPLFWAFVPIDALTIAALSAVQAVFALDFARRAGHLQDPPG